MMTGLSSSEPAADPFLDGARVERKGFFGAFPHTPQTDKAILSNLGKRIEGDGFCRTFFGAFAALNTFVVIDPQFR